MVLLSKHTSTTNTVHSATIWFTVFSLLPHNLHAREIFVCWLLSLVRTVILNAWSCGAVRNPSVSLFSIPVLSHFPDFGSLMSSVLLTNYPWKGFSWYFLAHSSKYEALSTPGSFTLRTSSLHKAFNNLSWDSFCYIIMFQFGHLSWPPYTPQC